MLLISDVIMLFAFSENSVVVYVVIMRSCCRSAEFHILYYRLYEEVISHIRNDRNEVAVKLVQRSTNEIESTDEVTTVVSLSMCNGVVVCSGVVHTCSLVVVLHSLASCFTVAFR